MSSFTKGSLKQLQSMYVIPADSVNSLCMDAFGVKRGQGIFNMLAFSSYLNYVRSKIYQKSGITSLNSNIC